MFRSILLLTLLALTALAFAQPDPANKPANPTAIIQPIRADFAIAVDLRAMAIEATANGVFVLRAGTLARFDAGTLQAQGTLDLLGPLPDPPRPGADGQVPQEAWMKWDRERMKRQGPAAMQARDDLLYIVLADKIFIVDQKAFKQLAGCSLDEDAALNANLWGMTIQQPMMTIRDNVIYVVRGQEIVAVTLKDGKATVSGRGKLPVGIPIYRPIIEQPVAIQERVVQPINDLPAGGAARAMTLIGRVHRVELEGGFWAVKDERDGAEYVLEGAALAKLTATPNVGNTRFRLTGTYSNHPGAAQYGNGYLAVTEFQALTDN